MGEKVLYKIGEVSKIVGVEPHVIRYWEKEIPFLVPTKRGKGGQRFYSKEDVDKLLEIKKMLYEDGMKIEGVRKFFKNEHKEKKKIYNIKKELLEIKELLEKI